MTLLYSEYIFLVILVVIIFSVAVLWRAYNFNQFIQSFWFAKIKTKNYLSIYLYALGIGFLLFSVLDLRGPVKNVETNSKQLKTIIMLDTSPSMLAEDVRPNRFKRALFLIKHLIRKMGGHQISVVLFSDLQRQLVPFTEDIDLIEARLSSLEDSNYLRGSTNLGKSIMESLQYFKNYSEDPYGNILIFTDAEETGDEFALKLPDQISLGIIGLGTRKGSTIPIRTRDGVFSGHKKHKGQAVITKLNEEWLKELSSQVKNYQYWVASSYDLPTEDIIGFMKNSDTEKKSKNLVSSRPVLYHYLVVPGILLLILASVLNFGRQYKPIASLFLFFFLYNSPVFAQGSLNQPPLGKNLPNPNQPQRPEQQPRQLTEEEIEEIKRKQHEAIQKELQVLKKRNLTDEEREIVAEKVKSIGGNKEYNQLMEEIISDKDLNQENLDTFFNKYTSDLEVGKLGTGLKGLKQLDDYIANNETDNTEKLREKINQNIKKALLVAKQQEQQQDQENKNNQDSDKDGKGKSKGKQGKNKKDDDKENENDEPSEKERNKSAKEREKEKKQKQKELKESLDESKMKNLKKKLPAILKQLVDDDRKLQQKMLDTSTDNRKRSYEKKDW